MKGSKRFGWMGLSTVLAMVLVAAPGFAEGGGHGGGHGEAAEGDGQWHPFEWIKTLGVYPFGPPGARTSRISDEGVTILDEDAVPDRPLRIELGDRFVGTGNVKKGFELPGGAVLQPSVLVSGLYRTAVQSFDNGRVVNSEWANRLDVFANIKLTNTTERIVVGMRPFDDNFTSPNPATGQFTGYNFRPDNRPGVDTDSTNHLNGDIVTLFFEAELAEIIPGLDSRDQSALDVHMVVGRQPLFFQEGILIFDTMDAVGVTKNQIAWPFGQNLEYTFLYAWDEINRGNNIEVDDTHLFLGSVIADFTKTTVNFDLGYVYDEGNNDFPGGRSPDVDGLYGGLSFVQRIGKLGTAARVVFSHAMDDRIPKGMAPTSVLDDGVVIFLEANYTPAWTENYLYWTFFWAIDNYTPMARMPGVGGPMGRAGINFAGVQLGRYAAAVPNFAQDVAGGAIGYQWWLDHDFRKNLVAEVAWRKDTNDINAAFGALALRYQQAIGQHVLLQLDLHGSVAEDRDEGWGSRVQMSFAF